MKKATVMGSLFNFLPLKNVFLSNLNITYKTKATAAIINNCHAKRPNEKSLDVNSIYNWFEGI
jgi:hypothetical protein